FRARTYLSPERARAAPRFRCPTPSPCRRHNCPPGWCPRNRNKRQDDLPPAWPVACRQGRATAFGDGPRFEHAFHLQAEVVVEAGRTVLLHDKAVMGSLLQLGWRLGSCRKAALAFVFLE